MGTPFIIKLASASFSHSFLVDPTCLLLLSSQLPPQEIKTLYIILFFYFYFISIYFISTINLIFMILFCSLILQKFHHIFKRLHFEAGMKTQNPNWKLEHKNWCRTWVYDERPGSSYLDPKTWSMTSVGGYFDFGDRSGWVLQFRRLKLVRWMWIKRMKIKFLFSLYISLRSRIGEEDAFARTKMMTLIGGFEEKFFNKHITQRDNVTGYCD